MKLYLKSLKNGGKLQLDEHIPYTAQMIATLTRHQIGTVERALEIFRQLGLVEQLHGGLLYMTDIELMIGQSSTEAERKRAARLENKALLPPRTKGGHLSDIRPPEKEIELEKEIEIKREIEKGCSARAYGRYQNVFLTDEELADLQASFPTVWGPVSYTHLQEHTPSLVAWYMPYFSVAIISHSNGAKSAVYVGEPI